MAINQYNQSVENENEMTLQTQQQIMNDYPKALKKLNQEIENLNDEITETKSTLAQLYKNIGYVCKSCSIVDAKKLLNSKIASLSTERLAIKNSELFIKKSRQSTESDKVERDIAQMGSELVGQMIQSYQKIDNFSSTSVMTNGEIVSDTKMQNQTLFRSLDNFWVYPIPADGNGFDVVVVSQFHVGNVSAVNKQPQLVTQRVPSTTQSVISSNNGSQPQADKGLYIQPDMILIPKGSFKMGSDNGESDEKPVHTVDIGYEFYMGKYEVSVGEFRKFIADTNYKTDADKKGGCYVWTGEKWEIKSGANWKNIGFEQKENHPVACVSHNDASEYATWLSRKSGQSYRLPTEAEWEYSAKADTNTKYSCGDSQSCLGDVAWYRDNSGSTTHTVGIKKPNPWGLYDMHGNVWEWTADWYSDYSNAPRDGSANNGGTQEYRSYRGGSWYVNAGSTRSAYRNGNTPDFRNIYLGFRLLRTK